MNTIRGDEALHILYLIRLFLTSNTFENIVCRIEVIFLSSICGMASPIDWYKAIYNPTQDDAGIVTICVCPNVFEMSLIWENIYIFVLMMFLSPISQKPYIAISVCFSKLLPLTFFAYCEHKRCMLQYTDNSQTSSLSLWQVQSFSKGILSLRLRDHQTPPFVREVYVVYGYTFYDTIS